MSLQNVNVKITKWFTFPVSLIVGGIVLLILPINGEEAQLRKTLIGLFCGPMVGYGLFCLHARSITKSWVSAIELQKIVYGTQTVAFISLIVTAFVALLRTRP